MALRKTVLVCEARGSGDWRVIALFLATNLLISSPKLTRVVVFEILYPNYSWLPPCHAKFEGGC